MGKQKKVGKSKTLKQNLILFLILLSVVIITRLIYLEISFNKFLEPINPARVLGNSNAPIKIIDYADFECPACADGSKQLRKYIEENSNSISWELRYFPLSNHKNSFRAAIYSECAARQDKFWLFADKLLDGQADWKDHVDVDLMFDKIAQDIGLNIRELSQCLKDQTIANIILKEKQKAESLGIVEIPTYYVNGKMGVGEEFLIPEIEKRLKKLIKK